MTTIEILYNEESTSGGGVEILYGPPTPLNTSQTLCDVANTNCLCLLSVLWGFGRWRTERGRHWAAVCWQSCANQSPSALSPDSWRGQGERKRRIILWVWPYDICYFFQWLTHRRSRWTPLWVWTHPAAWSPTHIRSHVIQASLF